MKVLDKSGKPYTPAWKMTNGYLRIKMREYRKKVEEERRQQEEEAFRQQQTNIYAWK